MKHHAIYVPGFGDDRARFQRLGIQSWRLFGVTPHYLPVGWTLQEGYTVKTAKITSLVETLAQHNKSVSLVGVSAGASICLNTFIKSNSIHKLICISGKIQSSRSSPPTTNMSDFNYSLSKAQQSLAQLQPSDVQKILTIHPHRDQVVPISDAVIPGTKDLTVPGSNHPVGIFWGITLGMVRGCIFLRRKI